MAEHHFVLARQVEALLGSSPGAVRRRLSRLEGDELVRPEPGFGDTCWLIERSGLRAIASDLPPPELRHSHYKHSVGLAWVWLAARMGAFGRVTEVIGERRLRSHDEADISAEELYSVRLGGYHADGRERRHYPDALLLDPLGRRLAVELELSTKRVAARQAILGGYGADRRLEGVLYLVEANELGRSIACGVRATAAQMGLLDRVHIRRVSPILAGPLDGGGRTVRAEPARARARRGRATAATELGR